MGNQLQLITQSLVSEGEADFGNVGAPNIVTIRTLTPVPWPQPRNLHLVGGVNNMDQSDHKYCGMVCVCVTLCGKPLMRTLFLANSHMSHELSFHT